MRKLASEYLDHFEIDLGPVPSAGIGQDAPPDLDGLFRQVAEIFGPGHDVAIYEALTVASESDFPHLEPIDENICPLDVYYFVLDYLGARLS